jgi:hypothetical protein
MTRHLQACGVQGAKSPPGRSFHLLIDQPSGKSYWLHLAVPVEATLEQLDIFLREIWLECCGHLSGFTIGGKRYVSDGMDELEMDVRVSRLLREGTVFSYEYDYGSTTELRLKVAGIREGAGKKIAVLARNDAPEVVCHRCGEQAATQICSECDGEGEGWYCEQCAEDHECGDEMCLPVVNSPRAGVCGYTG